MKVVASWYSRIVTEDSLSFTIKPREGPVRSYLIHYIDKAHKYQDLRLSRPGTLALNNFVCFFFLDKDECAENPCPPHSKCKNTLGSFSCECEQGFKHVNNSCIGMFCVVIYYPVACYLSKRVQKI